MGKIKLNSHFKGRKFNEVKINAYIDALLSRLNLLNRAYLKIGFSSDYFSEIAPINIIGYDFGQLSKNKVKTKIFKSGECVSNVINSTYLMFGKRQMYIYTYAFSTDFKFRAEELTEVFYKDISAISIKTNNYYGEDDTKGNFVVPSSFMVFYFGLEKLTFPIMPEFDINNEKLFNLRKIIRDKKFLT